MTLVDLPLTPAQARKLSRGQRVRLTKHHLLRNNTVQVNVSPRMAGKIQRRIVSGRGFDLSNEWGESPTTKGRTFDDDLLHGDGIGSAFKKMGRAVKSVAKTIRKEAPGAIKQAAHATGSVAQQAKKYVPKQLIKGAVNGLAVAGTTAIGQPQLASVVKRALNPAVDALYQTNLAHGSVGKNFGRNYVKNVGTSLFTMG